MLPIFQPEISTLKSEIERLQSQISARQSQMKLLVNWECSADGAIQTLQALVSEIQNAAPQALAPLKSAVMELFTGDDASDRNGNRPIAPHPQPGAGPDAGEQRDLRNRRSLPTSTWCR